MENIMQAHTPLATPVQARLRMSTSAFAGSAAAGRRAADLGVDFQGTGAPIFGYTPAVVDVVRDADFPGDMAWRPPV